MPDFKVIAQKIEYTLDRLEPFTPYEIPGELNEVTPNFLRNLYDLGRCYGLDDWMPHGAPKRMILLGLDHGVILRIRTDPDKPFMHIGKPGTYHCMLIKGASVTWNKNLDFGRVSRAAKETQGEMVKRGLVAEDGKRTRLMKNSDYILAVADYFRIGEMYELAPKQDAVHLLSRFDQPGLVCMTQKFDRRFLCLRRHEQTANRFIAQLCQAKEPSDPEVIQKNTDQMLAGFSQKKYS